MIELLVFSCYFGVSLFTREGKPLSRKEQFMSERRPHLDIPPLNLHHWPFDQFDDHNTILEKLKEKQQGRKEREERKALKR